MIRRATHSDKSIDDILQSIRNVINHKENKSESLPDTPEEVELRLTDMIADYEKSPQEALLSQDTRSKAESTLEAFFETATTLGHHKTGQKLEDSENIHNPIEDFMKNLLKPQLKEWLDVNLPNMVKQIVAEEIKSLVANIQKNRS